MAARAAVTHLAETSAELGFTTSEARCAIKDDFKKEGLTPIPRSNKDVIGFLEDLEAEGTIKRTEITVENGHGGRKVDGWKRVPKQTESERPLQFE
jgi:hypothetical protein